MTPKIEQQLHEAWAELQRKNDSMKQPLQKQVEAMRRENAALLNQLGLTLYEDGRLEAARSAFYALSMPMVQWREGLAEGSRPSVAYCPMHKKSWLQPGSKIGNPYGGMPGCGKIVSK